MAYSKQTFRNVFREARRQEKILLELDAADIPLCVSKGNRKIGRVLNVSLMPVLSCGNCKECMHICYDIKACAQYPQTVINARMRNLVVLKKDREGFFNRVDEVVSRRRTNKYFRWHVAGDIVDGDYFDRMVKMARRHPEFIMWTYTKMYHIVNEWIAKNGPLPPNFFVMFSEWRGMPMDNPYGMPEFRVVFKGETAPAGAWICPGNCDICKQVRRGCVVGETTYCHEH